MHPIIEEPLVERPYIVQIFFSLKYIRKIWLTLMAKRDEESNFPGAELPLACWLAPR